MVNCEVYLCLVCCITAHFVSCVRADCEPGWTRFRYKCLITSSVETTLPEAFKFCESKNATLVSLHSREEDVAAVSVSKGTIWLGLRQMAKSTMAFTWMDGSSFDYGVWPVEAMPSATCVGMVSQIGGWFFKSCDQQSYPVCQKYLTKTPKLTSTWPTRVLDRAVLAQKTINRLSATMDTGKFSPLMGEIVENQGEVTLAVTNITAKSNFVRESLDKVLKEQMLAVEHLNTLEQKARKLETTILTNSWVAIIETDVKSNIIQTSSILEAVETKLSQLSTTYSNFTEQVKRKNGMAVMALHQGLVAALLGVSYVILVASGGFLVVLWKKQRLLMRDIVFDNLEEMQYNERLGSTPIS